MRTLPLGALLGATLALTMSSCMAAPKEAAAAPLALAKDGKTAYVIVLGAAAIPAEQTAARELGTYLEQISGAKFTVKNESEVSETAPQILVGATLRVKRLVPKQNWAALGTDGIVIKTVGNKLILAGGQPRGTLYAVYSFLEDTLGVRWWTAEATFVPEQKTVRIPPQNVVYVPQIKMREVYNDSVRHDPVFATRLKNNGHFQTQGPELGGHDWTLGMTHTFARLLPPEKYFREHPEWYSDATNSGLPCTAASPMPSDHWQLCLSNEAARTELVKNALQWLRETPTATAIAVAQNDTLNPCACPLCREAEAEEGSPAGPMIRFVNKVAEDIEKEFPHVGVETLAYQYTQKPPRLVKPRENVIVRLCSIDADFARPLSSDANAAFRDDLLKWKKLTPRLAIWDYVTNFAYTMFPHPNIQVLGPNVRFFAANNAVALFEQGDAYTHGTGDFVAMRLWLLSHLMWNPSLDADKLQHEFMTNYYGAAAPHLQAYIDTIREAFLRQGKPLSTKQADHSYLTLKVMTEATQHMQAAQEAVANDATLLKRVRRENLALDHAWLLRYTSLKREASIDGVPFTGPTNPELAVDDFIRQAQEFKVHEYKEGHSFESYIPVLKAQFSKIAPLPDFARGKSAKDIIDAEETAYGLFGLEQGTTLVDDPKALNGRAVQMRGSVKGWWIQYSIDENDEFLNPGPWRCYIIARVQAKPGAIPGKVMTYGFYDTWAKRAQFEGSKSLAAVGDGEYHAIDIGTHALKPGLLMWISPPGREDIESISIDRIVMVREPATN